MSTERDTHFRGWAKLVQQELDMVFQKQVGFIYSGVTLYNGDEIHRLLEQVLAQRAYELALHIVKHVGSTVAPPELSDLSIFEMMDDHTEDVVNDIPDMAAWPVEPDEPSASNPA